MGLNEQQLPIRQKEMSAADGEPSRISQIDAIADDERRSHIEKSAFTSPSPLSSSTADSPSALSSLLPLNLPRSGLGRDGFMSAISPILQHSVNTSAPGFLDKLYSAPSPPGLASELLLSVLNTNLHVYAVSPVLSLIESSTAAQLASLFGLSAENGAPRAGGISVQGGSASNLTSIVVARNTLFPRTKTEGNWKGAGGKELTLFTSAHGHYSIEKAAQALGLGSSAVITVPVDQSTGAMNPTALQSAITQSREQGQLPFYVNATAGSTVLGSFDPFEQISEICRKEKVWMHVDGSWGGSFVFSQELCKLRLKGIEKADSIAINPHKMLQVPLTCSFLLGRDMKQFQAANTIQAGYLFHEDAKDPTLNTNGNAVDDETATSGLTAATNGNEPSPLNDESWEPPLDLATLTLQCGRRGDSLKMFMTWLYYGTEGLGQQVDAAYEVACHLSTLVSRSPSLLLVPAQRHRKPDCLQVCFWYVGTVNSAHSTLSADTGSVKEKDKDKETSNKRTAKIAARLKKEGFMIDYAPMMEGEAEAWRGSFFRVVVNLRTPRETVERLVETTERVGAEVMAGEADK
ncbi:MAG: hypothetical protein Q9227_005069 [Pyrenula ochraceoflavens]